MECSHKNQFNSIADTASGKSKMKIEVIVKLTINTHIVAAGFNISLSCSYN